MSSRYRISEEHNLCVLEVWGSVSDRDMLQIAKKIWDDPRWRPGMNQLNDFRHVDEMIVELNDMKAFVQSERERAQGFDGPEGKLAIVVTSDIHEAGMKLYGVLSRQLGHETRTFPSLRQAVEWLGADPRQIWPGFEKEPRT